MPRWRRAIVDRTGNPLPFEYDRQSRSGGTGRDSEHYTFVRYDERGCGLSDWNVADFSLDAWVGDLEAVADQFGTQRFALMGVSQGASVAIAYALRHPERVSHLILYGGYARGRFNRNPTAEQLEEAQTLIHLIRAGWGQDNSAFRQVFAHLLIPDGTPEQINWYAELARVSASAENAALMEMAFYNVNVAPLAPRIRVPTLVLHARKDAMCPFDEGRFMASLIPGARFVPLESNNHILLETEPALLQFQEPRVYPDRAGTAATTTRRGRHLVAALLQRELDRASASADRLTACGWLMPPSATGRRWSRPPTG
jgi:pimeloyl-ACP methyl ester carboxylesterase